MWYEYSQNNSGGSFVYDHDAGLAERVYIEADSASEADDRFESIGGYFNGIDDGYDCDCCGDRWMPAYGDGMTFEELREDVAISLRYLWSGNQNGIYIHLKDGTFFGDKDKGPVAFEGRLKELES